MQYLLRRKIVAMVAVFLTCGFAGKAQLRSLNLEEHDDKAFHFGINVGINRSYYNFTRHPQFLRNDSIRGIESVNSTGINLAWLVNKRLSNHLSLRTYPLNLVFTEKAIEYNMTSPDKPAGEDSITVKKVQGITLAFPLHLKFTSDRINNLKVYMFAGGKLEYDMAANAGKKKAEGLIKLNKLDYGIDAGIGFHIYFPVFVLSPEIKLGWGMRNAHAREENFKFSNVIDIMNARTLTFSLTVE